MRTYQFNFEHASATFFVSLHFEKGDITDIEQLAQIPSLHRRRWATQLFEMIRTKEQPFVYIGTLFPGRFGQRLLEEGWAEALVYHQLDNDRLYINVYSLYILSIYLYINFSIQLLRWVVLQS